MDYNFYIGLAGLFLLLIAIVIFGYIKEMKKEKEARDVIEVFFGANGIWMNREVDGKFITFVYDKEEFDTKVAQLKAEEKGEWK